MLPAFQSWLQARGIQADPDEAAAALWLAGHDGADVLDRELGVCLSRGLPIQMGILSALLSPWAKLLERLRDEPERAVEELPELDEVDAYLLGEWLPVTSSNVAAIRYLPEDEALEVEYLNGGFYRYSDIPPMMAKDFALASSPGGWVWDHLRVRGTVYGYQKPYALISGPSTYEPRWMKTLEKRLLHGKIQAEGIVPAAMLSNWQEALHPRGQPDNAGEFTKTKEPDQQAQQIQKAGVLQKLGKPGAWLKAKTQAVYAKLEQRYGRKQALAIMAAGQALGWGTTAAGAAVGVPVWLPGSSLWGAAPFAAIAEVYLQTRKLTGAQMSHGSQDHPRLTDEQIQRLGAKLVRHLKSILAKRRR